MAATEPLVRLPVRGIDNVVEALKNGLPNKNLSHAEQQLRILELIEEDPYLAISPVESDPHYSGVSLGRPQVIQGIRQAAHRNGSNGDVTPPYPYPSHGLVIVRADYFGDSSPLREHLSHLLGDDFSIVAKKWAALDPNAREGRYALSTPAQDVTLVALLCGPTALRETYH